MPIVPDPTEVVRTPEGYRDMARQLRELADRSLAPLAFDLKAAARAYDMYAEIAEIDARSPQA